MTKQTTRYITLFIKDNYVIKISNLKPNLMDCLILVINNFSKSYLGGAIAVLDHSDLQINGTNFTGNKAESLFNVITNPNCPQGNYSSFVKIEFN